jgi:hypothetical protein
MGLYRASESGGAYCALDAYAVYFFKPIWIYYIAHKACNSTTEDPPSAHHLSIYTYVCMYAVSFTQSSFGPLIDPGLGAASATSPPALQTPVARAGLEGLDGNLDLGAEAGAVEAGLVDDRATGGVVPAHAVDGALGPTLLKHDTDGMGEAHGVALDVPRRQEHVTLANDDVVKPAAVNDLEHHCALVLVEPLGRLVDMIICACVGPADNLGGRLASQCVGIQGAVYSFHCPVP